MNSTDNRIVHCVSDDSGVTAIEYALFAGLIAVVIVGAITATGTSLTAAYTAWSTAVFNAVQAAL
jgi:pilus assembly protein Flp/PilA